jgi:hypothetical protein
MSKHIYQKGNKVLYRSGRTENDESATIVEVIQNGFYKIQVKSNKIYEVDEKFLRGVQITKDTIKEIKVGISKFKIKINQKLFFQNNIWHDYTYTLNVNNIIHEVNFLHEIQNLMK